MSDVISLRITLCLWKLSSLIILVDVTEMLTYSISKVEYTCITTVAIVHGKV